MELGSRGRALDFERGAVQHVVGRDQDSAGRDVIYDELRRLTFGEDRLLHPSTGQGIRFEQLEIELDRNGPAGGAVVDASVNRRASEQGNVDDQLFAILQGPDKEGLVRSQGMLDIQNEVSIHGHLVEKVRGVGSRGRRSVVEGLVPQLARRKEVQVDLLRVLELRPVCGEDDPTNPRPLGSAGNLLDLLEDFGQRGAPHALGGRPAPCDGPRPGSPCLREARVPPDCEPLTSASTGAAAIPPSSLTGSDRAPRDRAIPARSPRRTP